MVKKRSLTKDVTGFAAAGVGLGVGSMIAAKAGAPAGVQSGFAIAGGIMPVIGTGIIGYHALSYVERLKPKKRKW